MRARQVRGWFVRLAGALGGGASDRELAEELESHLQLHVEDGVRAGLQPEEARRQALVKLGGVAATAERYREQRGLPWIDVLLQDTRHGLRRLAANPVFTAVALLSLALGIGANTAIFSLVNAMFFRPLPIERPQELVSFQNKARAGWGFLVFSYPNYKDLRDRNDVLAGLVAYRFAPLSVSHDGVSSKMWGYVVSGNYFDVLGVRASLGRTISPDDDRLPGGHPVTVVSHRYWRQSYGADPSVVGRTLNVNGRSLHGHRRRAGGVLRHAARHRTRLLVPGGDAGRDRDGLGLARRARRGDPHAAGPAQARRQPRRGGGGAQRRRAAARARASGRQRGQADRPRAAGSRGHSVPPLGDRASPRS